MDTKEANRIVTRIGNELNKTNDPKMVGYVLTALTAAFISAQDDPEPFYRFFMEQVRSMCAFFDVHIPLRGGDFAIVHSNQVAEAVADNPELAEFVRETSARLRSAMQNVDMSDPQAVAKMMESLGMEPVPEEDMEKIDEMLRKDEGRKVN